MIGGFNAAAARPVSPDVAARLHRFPLCSTDVALLDGAAGLQLVSLWQFASDPAPRITANLFVTDRTPAELRAIADHLDTVLARLNRGAA